MCSQILTCHKMIWQLPRLWPYTSRVPFSGNVLFCIAPHKFLALKSLARKLPEIVAVSRIPFRVERSSLPLSILTAKLAASLWQVSRVSAACYGCPASFESLQLQRTTMVSWPLLSSTFNARWVSRIPLGMSPRIHQKVRRGSQDSIVFFSSFYCFVISFSLIEFLMKHEFLSIDPPEA